MTGSDAQLVEEVKGVGANFQGDGNGGRGCPDLGKNLRDGGPGGPAAWAVGVGDDTTHWEGFGWIPPQGEPAG